jgi:hypothetical protein
MFARHHKMAYNLFASGIDACETTETLPISVADVA